MTKDIIHLGQAITVIITTTSNMEDAKLLARGLVENQIAACVQLSGITSIYTWQDKVEEDTEVRLMVKVIEERKVDAVRYIREHHPYDTPEIILTAFSSERNYHDWCRQVSGY